MSFIRFAVVAVLLASGAVVVYGLLFDRTGQSIAFTVAGLAALGITLAFVAAWFLSTSLGAARRGKAARAVLGGLVGGMCAVAASMALAAGAIFAIVTLTV
jgi:hypothetical protein